MSTLGAPAPAKLLIGIFTADKALLSPVLEELDQTFGPIDLCSPWFTFDKTRYYEKEMGANLLRRIVAFRPLVEQDRLADIKHHTNDIEKRFAKDGRRKINIDPGYLLRERFVLATGKNFTHRIYIGQKVYADLTLVFTKGRFQTLPWTYPDYAEPAMLEFLCQVRDKYVADIRPASAASALAPPSFDKEKR